MIPVVLLAGGLGTRLAAASGGLPKALVTVAGRPFVEYVERTAWPPKFSFEHDFLEARLDDLRPLGVESDSYFVDIGVPEDLARARLELVPSI